MATELWIILLLGSSLTSMTIAPEVQGRIIYRSSSECAASDLVVFVASEREDYEMMIYHLQMSLSVLQNVTTLCLEKQHMIGCVTSIRDGQAKHPL